MNKRRDMYTSGEYTQAPPAGDHSEMNTLRAHAARFARALRPLRGLRLVAGVLQANMNHVYMLAMLQTNLIELWLQKVPGVYIISAFYDRYGRYMFHASTNLIGLPFGRTRIDLNCYSILNHFD